MIRFRSRLRCHLLWDYIKIRVKSKNLDVSRPSDPPSLCNLHLHFPKVMELDDSNTTKAAVSHSNGDRLKIQRRLNERRRPNRLFYVKILGQNVRGIVIEQFREEILSTMKESSIFAMMMQETWLQGNGQLECDENLLIYHGLD